MKIYSYYLLEKEQEFIDELKNDRRLQVRYPYCFCLDQDQIEIEQKYGIRFSDGYESLRELLFDGIDNILDWDLMCRDDLKSFNPSLLLFYNDFDQLLKRIESLMKSNLEYLIKNYDECKKNYIDWMVKLSDRIEPSQ